MNIQAQNPPCNTVKIGKYEISGYWLAPMAGYTDIAFRTLCREEGAALTPTEMVSVRGLVHGNEATDKLMRTAECETPSCVQLFGNEPSDFARAAQLLGCDIIDVNMGCPMPKIVKNGDGAALLNDPERAGRIVAALVSSADKPVTVKTRLGYGMNDARVFELVQAVEEAGAAAVAVHGRYAEQRYAGAADLDTVKAVAERAHIPVIANGDIDASIAAKLSGHMFATVMIGRAALSGPCVFGLGRAAPLDMAYRHLRLLRRYFDERYTVNQCRKFFVHYFKGVKGGKALRDAVNKAQSSNDVLYALDAFSENNR